MTVHNCEWKRKYLGMVKERDEQVRRKREARRILTERLEARNVEHSRIWATYDPATEWGDCDDSQVGPTPLT